MKAKTVLVPRLAGVATRMRRAGVRDVETSVWYGPPAEAIADAVLGATTPVLILRPGKSAPVLGRTFWEVANV